ncbi:DUF3108 domain-containing protein [Lysobacter pythonis]|uniref:DUF3108 domain-containing protein n=1 Tax=Solilutibacter pythonis TaxID=2483112 RepID=A0A3M2I6M9_9GAMM|nr:DUF3108 domain-containing protein [Lysobacter pythonis]RMH94107.1 DUF3108 domain-containing protein [Lysobacter pythonis]
MNHATKTGLGATMLLALALPVARAAELKPFNASYRASYNNMAANATMSLAPAGSDRWNYNLSMQNALVQLSRSAVVDASGAQLRPLSNRETINMVVKKRNKQGSYDWSGQQARWSGDIKPDRQGPVRLQAGDVDGMTLNLAIVQDALAGKPMRYRLIENGKASAMNFSVAGRENMTVAGKPTETIKVISSDGGTTRTVWVAEGIPLPVRILQKEDDGDTIDLRLQSMK